MQYNEEDIKKLFGEGRVSDETYDLPKPLQEKVKDFIKKFRKKEHRGELLSLVNDKIHRKDMLKIINFYQKDFTYRDTSEEDFPEFNELQKIAGHIK